MRVARERTFSEGTLIVCIVAKSLSSGFVVIIAPQAQLEESANDRSKPEVLISRVLKRDPLPDLATPFERFCDWYLTFSCPKPGPGPHRIGPEILLFVLFFVSPVFEQVDGRTVHFSEKSRSKTGTCTGFCRGSRPFSVSGPIRLIRGRWHSPQVAPAAPPAPRVHSSNENVPKIEVKFSRRTN